MENEKIQKLEKYYSLLRDAIRHREWEKFEFKAQDDSISMRVAFDLLNHLPEDRRRHFVYDCYMRIGDSLGCCRKEIRKLPKNGLQELPPDIANLSEITIYRGGTEVIEKAPLRISWSLDFGMARWFYRRNILFKRPAFLYAAKIRPCDVIGYLTDREESEVLQYRTVYDVVELESRIMQGDYDALID